MKSSNSKSVKKKRYTFVLNTGYVESASVGYVPFTSRERFSSVKEALVDLAMFFKKQITDDNNVPDHCCKTTQLNDSDAMYCSRCGNKLETYELSPDEIVDFVNQVCCADVDGYFSLIPYCDNPLWEHTNLDDAMKKTEVVFVYHAESVIALAAGHSPAPSVCIQDVFRHAKNGGRTISFW